MFIYFDTLFFSSNQPVTPKPLCEGPTLGSVCGTRLNVFSLERLANFGFLVPSIGQMWICVWNVLVPWCVKAVLSLTGHLCCSNLTEEPRKSSRL